MNAKHNQTQNRDNESIDSQDMTDTENQAEASVEQVASGEVLEGFEEELVQTKDQLLRLSADFDNYRKRIQREKEDWGRYAAQGLIEKMLPVLDGLDRAASSITNVTQETQNVLEGFTMIQKQLGDILEQEGLKEIPALGETFDPNIHDAVMHAPPESGELDNQVVMVLRKGYQYRDRVLRASMVKVAKE